MTLQLTLPAVTTFAGQNADGTPRGPSPADAARWGSEIERLIMALIAGTGGLTLPNLMIRYTITGGTPNAIVASPNLTPPVGAGLALFTIAIAQPNTGNVTINGKPLLTNGGEQIAAGEIQPGDLLLFLDNGADFRLLMDTGSLRNKLAAQAAQVAAGAEADRGEVARLGSEAARDIAAGYAADAVSQGNVPIYSTLLGMPALAIPSGQNRIYVSGWAATADGLGGMFVDEANGSDIAFTTASAVGAAGRSWYRARDVFGDRVGEEFINDNAPFGRTGMKIIAGELNNAHVGFGGILNFASGKWVAIYRRAGGAGHGTVNGAELRARDSYDKGNSWVNDRLLYTEVDNDARPDAPRIMANNRGGFFVNRAANPTATRKFPLFFKTDDEGATFTSQVVETASTTYTFQGHSGLMNWPASKGGHDTLGFMSFGYVAPGGMGALRTANNGDTWGYVTDVAMPGIPQSEILQDPGFSSGIGWVTTAPWTIANGRAVKTVSTGNLYATLAGFVPGTEATITVNVESISGGTFKLAFFQNGTALGSESADISNPGLHSVKLTIPTSANRLYVIGSVASVQIGLKHLSLRAQRTDGTAISAISESMGFKIAGQDQWVFFSRANAGGWRTMMTVWVTTDPFNWGLPLDAGVSLLGNPPGGLYDAVTGNWHMLNFGRGGRGIAGFDQHVLHIEANAEDLFNAAGSFAALEVGYEVLTPVPSWATGYIAPFKDAGKWHAAFTCGEPGISGGATSLFALIGDFVPRAADTMKLVDYLIRRQRDVRDIDFHADDNLSTTYPIKVSNASRTLTAGLGAYGLSNKAGDSATSDFLLDIGRSLLLGTTAQFQNEGRFQVTVSSATNPALVTESPGTSQARTHYTLRNGNGPVGSISTSGAATAFNTTSDESWKEFIGELDPVTAIDIIRRDPVREFHWDEAHGGGYAVGWGAQTSYAVSPDLASPGGWFDDDGNELMKANPGAVYMPWGVDQSKRTPYLWATVAWLLDERDSMRREIDVLERRLGALEAK